MEFAGCPVQMVVLHLSFTTPFIGTFHCFTRMKGETSFLVTQCVPLPQFVVDPVQFDLDWLFPGRLCWATNSDRSHQHPPRWNILFSWIMSQIDGANVSQTYSSRSHIRPSIWLQFNVSPLFCLLTFERKNAVNVCLCMCIMNVNERRVCVYVGVDAREHTKNICTEYDSR